MARLKVGILDRMTQGGTGVLPRSLRSYEELVVDMATRRHRVARTHFAVRYPDGVVMYNPCDSVPTIIELDRAAESLLTWPLRCPNCGVHPTTLCSAIWRMAKTSIRFSFFMIRRLHRNRRLNWSG